MGTAGVLDWQMVRRISKLCQILTLDMVTL
jgi:hypothetical protein